MKRIKSLMVIGASVLLLGSGVLSSVQPVYATSIEDEEEPDSEMTEEEKEEKRKKEELEKRKKEVSEMKIESNELDGWPEGPKTYGESGIVMDADTGAILYAKNIDAKQYPASITKVLTALLALQEGNLNQKITITPEALDCLGSGYASIGLDEGDVITMEQALYAMLLASANEAAYAVGEAVAENHQKDYDWFLEEMNRTVQELGGENSNFINTNGVFDEKHYTCARDMALIGRELFKYPEFFKICQTQEYKISETDEVEEHVFQQRHHMMIEGNKHYDESVIGGKTGYTTEAENTLITLAEKDDKRFVCVILKTITTYPYTDTKKLFEYGFDNFEKVDITDELSKDDMGKVLSFRDDKVEVTLPKDIDFDDLEFEVSAKADEFGEFTVTFTYQDSVVGSTKAMKKHTFSKANVSTKSVDEKVPETKWSFRNIIIAIVGGIIIFLILLRVILGLLIKRKKRLRRKRRREQLRRQRRR